MSAALIAQLLATYGPNAFQMIKDLVGMWTKPALTPEEVLAFCDRHKKSYEEYQAEARAAVAPKPLV